MYRSHVLFQSAILFKTIKKKTIEGSSMHKTIEGSSMEDREYCPLSPEGILLLTTEKKD